LGCPNVEVKGEKYILAKGILPGGYERERNGDRKNRMDTVVVRVADAKRTPC